MRKKNKKISSPLLSFLTLGSCNKFHVLVDKVMQAGILDKEKPEKNRNMILREEKTKKKQRKRKM